MSEEEEEDISQLENLKSLVSQRLRETGALPEIKANLRLAIYTSIINKRIGEPGHLENENIKKIHKSADDTLMIKLIYDYFRSKNLKYCQSILLAETDFHESDMSKLPNDINSLPPITSDENSSLLVKLVSNNHSSSSSSSSKPSAPTVQTSSLPLPKVEKENRNGVLSPEEEEEVEETFDDEFGSNTFESLDTRTPSATPQASTASNAATATALRKPVQNQLLEQSKKSEMSIEDSSSLMMSLESSVEPSAIMHKGDYVEEADA